jgi:hypothetical protein
VLRSIWPSIMPQIPSSLELQDLPLLQNQTDLILKSTSSISYFIP